MVKTYINLSNTDVENSLLEKMYGIKTNSSNQGEKDRICSKCSETNPYFYKICQRCKTPLDEKELIGKMLSEEKVKEVDDWSKTFMAFLKVVEKKHPDIWDDMQDIINKKADLQD